MAEMNKAKIEKEAKKLEATGLGQQLTTDNKSCIRAIARWKAVKSLYPEVSEQEAAEGLVAMFYKGAKFQKSWEELLLATSQVFLGKMQGELGVPAPRGRRKEKVVGMDSAPSGQPDPESTVAPVE